jgi:hypothetical protein
LKNALAYYNAGVVAENLKVIGLAPEGSFLNGFSRLQEKVGAYSSVGFGSVHA